MSTDDIAAELAEADVAMMRFAKFYLDDELCHCGEHVACGRR